jgi:hypothetical protein
MKEVNCRLQLRTYLNSLSLGLPWTFASVVAPTWDVLATPSRT